MQFTVEHTKTGETFLFMVDEFDDGFAWLHLGHRDALIAEGDAFQTEAEAQQDAFDYAIQKINKEEQELADRLEEEMRGDWVLLEA